MNTLAILAVASAVMAVCVAAAAVMLVMGSERIIDEDTEDTDG